MEMITDIFTNMGSRRDFFLGEIMLENNCRQEQNDDELVIFEDGKIKIKNLLSKKEKEVTNLFTKMKFLPSANNSVSKC